MLIRVYVAPRASANRVVGAHNGAVKITLTAPPVEGAANKALVEFLAKLLGVPKGDVELASGESSRSKVVRVVGVGGGGGEVGNASRQLRVMCLYAFHLLLSLLYSRG